MPRQLTPSWIMDPNIRTIAGQKRIVAEIEFFEGANKLMGYQAQFYLDNRPLGEPQVADITGRVRLTADGNILPGAHVIRAEVVGRAGYADKPLEVELSAQQEELQKKPVLKLVVSKQIESPTTFQVPVAVTLIDHGLPASGKQINLSWGENETMERITNSAGVVMALIKIVDPGLLQVLVSAVIDGQPVYDSVIIELKKSALDEVYISDPVFISDGKWSVRTIAQDINKQRLSGVMLNAIGGLSKILDKPTNENGYIDFELDCFPNQRKTHFTIDVVGVKKSIHFDLTYKQSIIEIVPEEDCKPADSPAWEIFSQGDRVGRGKATLKTETGGA